MVIVANKPGQLGNRLFVFAHLIALSLSAGTRVANPAFDEYAALFRGTRRDPLCRYPSRPMSARPPAVLRRVVFLGAQLLAAIAARTRARNTEVVRIDWEQVFDLSDPTFEAVARSRRLIILQGWLFRHEPGAHRFREEITHHLRPIPEIEERVAQVVAGARSGTDLLVGVHIRRGDYRDLHRGAYYFEIDEYVGLLRRSSAELQRELGVTVSFLICSDESLDPSAFTVIGQPFTIGSGTAVEDLYALAACDLLIGPPSTFSMWASYYGGVPIHILHDPAVVAGAGSFEVFRMEGYPTSLKTPGPTYW